MNKEKAKRGQQKKDYRKTNLQAKGLQNNSIYFNFVGLVIIILLGCIIYSNSFNCSFQFDDSLNIVDNPKIHNFNDVKGLWNYNHNRFIPNFTFAFNYHYDKLNVWGYHLFNLIIHLLNSLLVWWLALLLLSTPNLKNNSIVKYKNIIALGTALLFVSHPLATQSVTYIVQRIAALAALFYFLSLALYIKARLQNKGNVFRYFLFACSFVSAIAAILSKENAYTLPFAIVLVEIIFLQTKKLTVNFKDYRVILSIVALFGFVLIVYLKFSSKIFQPIQANDQTDFITITSMNYLLTQFSVIVKYIQLLFVPLNQNLDYDFQISNNLFEIKTVLSLLFLLSLVSLAIFLLKRYRLISFGIFWFFLTLSIESSFVPISDLIFEHRTYIPSFGFFLILSSVLYLLFWNKYKFVAIGILTIIVVWNSYLTYERNTIWKTELSLWNDVISKSPNKARTYVIRGILYANEKKYDEAISDFNKAIELRSDFAKAYSNRGIIFKNQKKYDEALADYDKAIELKPDYDKAYYNRGFIYYEQKNYKDALADYNKAIGLNRNYTEAYFSRGATKFNSGNKDGACKDWKKAVGLGSISAKGMINKYCN